MIRRILVLGLAAACAGCDDDDDSCPPAYRELGVAAHYEAFEAAANGVGTDARGYWGAIFDGRHLYFAPYQRGAGTFHGEVLRYDTQAPFSDASSWTAFDPGSNGVGTDPDGYAGGVFDGRYVYFAPNYNGTANHGEVLRYDTQGSFTAVASWSAYDPGANGVGTSAVGFYGAVFDGRHVYFVPNFTGAASHGEVLRYDTAAPFSDASSWTAYNPDAQGVGTDPRGFAGGVFDGRYVYFVPFNRDFGYSGEVLRYDTHGLFTAEGSWTTFDPASLGVGDDPVGFVGGVFDGRFIYFVPTLRAGGYHGEVLRYDTRGSFTALSSWTAFTPAANGVGDEPVGYAGAVFDGRYVLFAPFHHSSDYHGEVMRYDTTRPFDAASSWETFTPAANGVGTNATGYVGAAFDGRHVYFVPFANAGGYHGEVLRFEAKSAGELPATIFGGSTF